MLANSCRIATIEGEVERGSKFQRPIGGGLVVLLQPLPSGWRLRVVPARKTDAAPDYAELATPPYQSVSPLLIDTDFGLRSQDAIAWNPRRFKFAADASSFAELLVVYNRSQQFAKGDSSGEHQAAETELVKLLGRAIEAELTILDARFVEGAGDQSAAAATVALHLSASDHTLDQPADGKTTLLGQLNWLRFRLRLNVPEHFKVAPGVVTRRGRCL